MKTIREIYLSRFKYGSWPLSESKLKHSFAREVDSMNDPTAQIEFVIAKFKEHDLFRNYEHHVAAMFVCGICTSRRSLTRWTIERGDIDLCREHYAYVFQGLLHLITFFIHWNDYNVLAEYMYSYLMRAYALPEKRWLHVNDSPRGDAGERTLILDTVFVYTVDFLEYLSFNQIFDEITDDWSITFESKYPCHPRPKSNRIKLYEIIKRDLPKGELDDIVAYAKLNQPPKPAWR
jgi:hypothetical protein